MFDRSTPSRRHFVQGEIALFKIHLAVIKVKMVACRRLDFGIYNVTKLLKLAI
jgi:hypothetical protein